MIIGANKRGNGGQLAAYLLNQEKNERAELVEMRGFADMGNLKGALNGIELEAMQTNGTKPFYHCWLRLDEGESLTAAQWQQSFAAVEHRLHLEGQARVVVAHQLQNETHYHVVWSLVDRERGQMIEIPFDGMRRTEVARKLEKEFGLRTLAPAHAPEQERLRREEWQQAERTPRGADGVRDVKAAIREAWQRSDSGATFCMALEEQHLMLALGDSERRPFGVVDEQGQFHVLTRTLDVRAKEVRGKLADLDREQMPSVEQAHELLQERQAERGRESGDERQAGGTIQKDGEAREPERQIQEEPARAEELAAPLVHPEADRTEVSHTAPKPARERDERNEDTHAAREEGGGFRVFDQESGLASGVSAFAGQALDTIATQAEGVIEGIASLFDGGSTAPRVPQQAPARAPKSALQRLQERAAKERALQNISKSVQRGDDLNAADLRALPPAELERLRDGGDEYLMRLVQRYEREREERDWGRERER
ncbi:MAG: relaxase/mobilization nuclease domain-containing protein [Candidatus Competibacter sp.]